MTIISRLMIRLSLVYLLIGLSIGVLLLINKAWLISPLLWFLLPIHIEFMIFGWIIQFTLGVAYWILPRVLETKGRGNVKLAWLMLASVNTGIILVTISGYFPGNNFGFAGRILETLAVLLFIALHWKRVVTYNRS
ncbi:MAG: cbb3-type cytochrome c oxidase subunit I [Balneolaceae bacterium]